MEKIEEWCEHTGIDWWKEGRIKLNKVIRKYNRWIEKHQGNRIKTAKLLLKIERHLEMEYCNKSGGSGWKDELLDMKENVKLKLG